MTKATSGIQTLYSARYARVDTRHLYPVEFVVRAFLGTYPGLTMDRARYDGASILDLGYGDGRNMPLLHNLGFRLHGVEIHETIIASTRDKMARLGIEVDLQVGSNARIPYPADFFDYVLACHACYYVEEGTTFRDNRTEIHRVMRKDGVLVCSLPMSDTYVLDGAEPLSDGHWRITNDPYGLRAGTVFRAFRDESDIVAELGAQFTDFQIGFCDDFYWGIRQKVWIVVCRRI